MLPDLREVAKEPLAAVLLICIGLVLILLALVRHWTKTRKTAVEPTPARLSVLEGRIRDMLVRLELHEKEQARLEATLKENMDYLREHIDDAASDRTEFARVKTLVETLVIDLAEMKGLQHEAVRSVHEVRETVALLLGKLEARHT